MALKSNLKLMLNVGVYLASTQHMTAAESGAYLHLLMACRGYGGSLPKSTPAADVDFARICRLAPNEWAEVAPNVLQFFEEKDGRIYPLHKADIWNDGGR